MTAPAPRPVVEIAALEWQEYKGRDGLEWSAEGLFRGYEIIQIEGRKTYYRALFKNFDSLDKAKASCQADADRRLTKAPGVRVLDPATHVVVPREPTEAMIEAMFDSTKTGPRNTIEEVLRDAHYAMIAAHEAQWRGDGAEGSA